MERGEVGDVRKKRSKWAIPLVLLVVLVLLIIIAVVLGVTLTGRQSAGLKTDFLNRCQNFKGYDCENIWKTFKQVFVNRDPCNVSEEAYDPLIAAVPFKRLCNQTMLWSKTNKAVHELTTGRDCLQTIEDTVLGSSLNNLSWCGMKGSEETFTTGCPEWNECVNNSVRSFWRRASAAFAEVACGDVSVMLNGSISTPFNPTSVFASIEVPRLNSTKVKSLNVVLVTNSVSNCSNASLQSLKTKLDQRIVYTCKEVTESQITDCSAKPDCGRCW
uniref:ADP-ribosyl cyclase/cyclic ADP-ribose hydrolase n=1 Tax=Nothobranchius kadleci TaxID=1051664 RepID=A0A1A8BQM0_NOTKA